jgi:long-chain acyl-CoA synthetase
MAWKGNDIKVKKNIFYDETPKRDLREFLGKVVEANPNSNAFLSKINGKYEPTTYREFQDDINALGTAFVDLGLKNEKIGVIGENRYEWCVTYMATVNGTGVIVPLDKELSTEELIYLCRESGLKAVVYSDKQASKIKKIAQVCENLVFKIPMDETGDLSYSQLIEKGKGLLAEGNREFLDAEIDPDVMSMLLFTSGTTGVAKGVMLCHSNITSNVAAMKSILKIVPGDLSLSILPIHHTFECTCGFLTIIGSGGTVAFCEGLKFIAENIRETKPTILVIVPLIIENVHSKIMKKAEASLVKKVVFNLLLAIASVLSVKSRRKIFKTVHASLGGRVHHIISGASALSPSVSRSFDKMGLPILQGYGMTECSPCTAGNPEKFYKHGALGMALPGYEMKIDNPDKDGIGEILIKGPHVMLGYYNMPEETAKTIVDGWLHSGDYGKVDKDGFYTITGRKKNLIVTKTGKNIFPEELEEYLNNSPFILESVVSDSEEDITKENFIQAHIVPNFENIKEVLADRIPSMDEIKKIIGEEIKKINKKLPTFKRIRNFHIREDEFEKTTTKKIKRHNKKD